MADEAQTGPITASTPPKTQDLVIAPESNTGKQKRLTDLDKAFALRYQQEGLTQVVIAQRLGVTQSAISQWLSKCQDTTAEAGLYFRGRALSMAEKVVKKGKPNDLIAALKGVSVLQEERAVGLVVQIGIKDSDVQVTLNPPASKSQNP
jgi:predicted XRE-type DNA-binding protein